MNRTSPVISLIGVIVAGAKTILSRLPRVAPALAPFRSGAGDVLHSVAEATGEVARSATRIGAAPADQVLGLWRERLLPEVPEAADTKWRVSALLLGETVARLAETAPDVAGHALEGAGRVYAEGVGPAQGWNLLTLSEATRRLARSLGFEGTVARRVGHVEFITTACPLLAQTEVASHPALCESVCGAEQSLFSGVAAGRGAQIESPERMGTGAPRCVRRFTVARTA